MEQPNTANISVYPEYRVKHFVFTMANDGSTEPKVAGEWLTQKSIEGWDVCSQAVDFVDGRLHMAFTLKIVKQRKFDLPQELALNTKVVTVAVSG